MDNIMDIVRRIVRQEMHSKPVPGADVPTIEVPAKKEVDIPTAAISDEHLALLAACFSVGINRASDLSQIADAAAFGAACQKAGLESADEVPELKRRAQAGNFALARIREEHDRAAVAFFGQENADAIKSAKEWADGCDDYSLISATVDRYWKASPGADRDKVGRLTKSTIEDADNIADREKNAGKQIARAKIDVAGAYAALAGKNGVGGGR